MSSVRALVYEFIELDDILRLRVTSRMEVE